MPLISSGAISLGRSATTAATNSAGHRLAYASGQTISMNESDVRDLAEVSTTSGVSWSLSSLYGKPTWAYTATYDGSNLTGWTQSTNSSGGGSARNVSIYNSIHWKFSADGNLVPYVYQTRRVDAALSFDIQFDVMSNTNANPVQIQIGANSSLAGTGFRYNTNNLVYNSFSSSTDIGTAGSTLMTWYDPCASPTGTSRVNLWTRLRFVGTRSGTTWSGTITVISLAPANSGTVLGTAAFSFTNSGQYIVVRSYANADSGGEACFVDSAIITVD